MSEPISGWVQPSEPLPPGAAPSLPGMLVTAAVILFVTGALSALVGLLLLASGALVGQLPNTTGLSDEQFRRSASLGSAFVVGFGVAGVVAAAAHIGAGVGILRRRGWARIIGMVLSVLLILVSVLLLIIMGVAVSQPVSQQTLATSGLTAEEYRQLMGPIGAVAVGIFGVSLVAYVFVLVALIRRGSAFS
jgi:TRAP-type C4-dicarboxylate transport system permease small subunit